MADSGNGVRERMVRVWDVVNREVVQKDLPRDEASGSVVGGGYVKVRTEDNRTVVLSIAPPLETKPAASRSKRKAKKIKGRPEERGWGKG